ncbi:MAG: hypothetical protein ACKN86_08170 [Crocinitomicaceae bacterium]
MKKIILSALLISSLNLYSQISVEVGVKRGYNATWLFNKNISDQRAEQDYATGWGSNYGLVAAVYYGPIGLGVEFLRGTHTGGYVGDYPLDNSLLYPTYEKTNAVSGGIIIGLNYIFEVNN